jgi:hypothetical protein
MPVQVTALPLVVGDAVASIEFQATGDLHEGVPEPNLGRSRDQDVRY